MNQYQDYCRNCGRMVYAKTLAYSRKIYGEPYCYKCQQGRLYTKEDGTVYEYKPVPLKNQGVGKKPSLTIRTAP